VFPSLSCSSTFWDSCCWEDYGVVVGGVVVPGEEEVDAMYWAIVDFIDFMSFSIANAKSGLFLVLTTVQLLVVLLVLLLP